ncbi:MAG TPA: alpha-amylase family glycosyl hydrolase [Sedimentisphaerales bacterium]|nr:alpha-amylase family glycosyl hydrolase [Sedimentisphaerales bacterium]HRS09471.1 alpha-amylase family glycosyl hydrolase [Sedimentisphaerales bacterium]HRV46168.1 alpha-amylase family glycosyl hydrolase [Sedimentisphaerales bacterium]
MREAREKTSDSLWYKDAVVYELHIKSFHDSNDDGVGDIRGVIEKLDYLQDLGVTALWLLPFYPSPLLDDGYDIADYFGIHPDYGTLSDFKRLLGEAHRRELRIITELVINHTSDQHQWFQRSRRAEPGSPWRDFYVWSDTTERYKDARITFTDFESSNWTWDPVAQAYYWHRFYKHQPDLNYDNPRVRREILRVLDFWFQMGVDGMRLDAVPYLVEREDTNCENLPETHAVLKELRAHLDRKFSDRLLLAEANQWPEDAAAYFGNGDECHMAFHFPIMPRLVGRRGGRCTAMLPGGALPQTSGVLKTTQSNTSIVYDRTFFLKLYRRLEPPVNPEAELLENLTEHTDFANLPAYAGAIEWQPSQAPSVTIASLLEFVPCETDAWSYTLDNVERSFGHAQTLKDRLAEFPVVPPSFFDINPDAIPMHIRNFVGSVYIEMVVLLGRRTAQLHRALASLTHTPEVTSEPFSLLYQKSLHQSIRGMTLKIFAELDRSLAKLDAESAAVIRGVLAERKTILARLRRIGERKIRAKKIRIHGNYHLGQVLYTGKDFTIVDFEGEPARPITERRLRQSALRDVAGMIRSFHYAAHGAILRRAARQGADIDYLEYWADLWYTYTAGAFLHAYTQEVADADFVPADRADFALLLDTFLLEKAVYELGYELNKRPEWLMIPARGIVQILKGCTTSDS